MGMSTRSGNLSQPVTDGGVVISHGVGLPTFGNGVGRAPVGIGLRLDAHVADPDRFRWRRARSHMRVDVECALALNRPADFRSIGTGSDDRDGRGRGYALPASAVRSIPMDLVFDSRAPWLATVPLNEAPTKLVVTVQPGTSLPCRRTIQPPVSILAGYKGNTSPRLTARSRCPSTPGRGAHARQTVRHCDGRRSQRGPRGFSNLCIDQLSTPGTDTHSATAPEVNLSVESSRFSIGVL